MTDWAARMSTEYAAPLPHSATVPARTMTFDTDDRLTGVDGNTLANDANGNRTNVTRVDGSQVGYGYDLMNQLTSALGYEPDGTTFRGNENFGYGYDAANSLAARTNNTLQQAFVSDNANELVTATRNNDLLTVAGSVNSTGNAFTINGQNASVYHDLTFAVTNGVLLANGRNVFTGIAISNSVPRTNTLVQYLPASQNVQYDANGNLINDGLFTYEYDCANELTRVTSPDVSRTEYVYDGFGRRRIRRDYGYATGAYTLTNETRYIYDGMVVIQERSNNVPVVSYTRGTDMSGSMQGAGGIGGLLARTDANGSALYHEDANGNVTMLIDSSGNLLAKYLYDPFGNTLGMWGTLANVNMYRYSSKEIDRQSGVYYYGFRYYQPNLQRWLNRDPIEERGGFNLYRFVENDPSGRNDPFGFADPSYPYYDLLVNSTPPSTRFFGPDPSIYLVPPNGEGVYDTGALTLGTSGFGLSGIEYGSGRATIGSNGKPYWNGWGGGSRARICTTSISEAAHAAGAITGGLGVMWDVGGYFDGDINGEKLSINTAFSAIGYYGGPPGTVLAGTYFGVDNFVPGGWPGVFASYGQAIKSNPYYADAWAY